MELAMKINQKNSQLVKCLRNRERLRIKESKHCDMVTAVLQAWSGKTSMYTEYQRNTKSQCVTHHQNIYVHPSDKFLTQKEQAPCCDPIFCIRMVSLA